VSSTARETALRFVEAINRHDVDGLLDLMTDSHRFVDSVGRCIAGKPDLRESWKGYFALFPDYRITLVHMADAGDVVGLFGFASGTYAVNGELQSENRWEIPAAWLATVEEGQVVSWQVYADNDPVRRIVPAGGEGR